MKALGLFFVALSSFGFCLMVFRRVYGTLPAAKSEFVKCWHCEKTLTLLQRYMRIDGFCNAKCKRTDMDRFRLLAIDRLTEVQADYKRSLLYMATLGMGRPDETYAQARDRKRQAIIDAGKPKFKWVPLITTGKRREKRKAHR